MTQRKIEQDSYDKIDKNGEKETRGIGKGAADKSGQIQVFININQEIRKEWRRKKERIQRDFFAQ